MKSFVSIALTSSLLLLSPGLRAHEAGAPFSGAIIDPLLLHHAHIENEQRINVFSLRGVDNGRGGRTSAFEAEVEVGYASPDFRYGFEVFLPILDIPSPDGTGREAGIGDMEIRPVKLALINRPDFIVSTATGIGLPTGDQSRGLGEGRTSLTQFLFIDKAIGNWYVGANFGLGTTVRGDKETPFEYGLALSYSFIRGGERGRVAEPLPKQSWVASPSIEFVGERDLRASDSESTSLTPGLTFWHTRSGWQLHFGVQVPVSGEREAESTVLIQLGNHLNWGALFR